MVVYVLVTLLFLEQTLDDHTDLIAVPAKKSIAYRVQLTILK